LIAAVLADFWRVRRNLAHSNLASIRSPQEERAQDGEGTIEKQSREEEAEGGQEQKEEKRPAGLAIHASTYDRQRPRREAILLIMLAGLGAGEHKGITIVTAARGSDDILQAAAVDRRGEGLALLPDDLRQIVDPTVVNGGSVELGSVQTFPRYGLDLPDITFGPRPERSRSGAYFCGLPAKSDQDNGRRR
jgi:hypothetical protein